MSNVNVGDLWSSKEQGEQIVRVYRVENRFVYVEVDEKEATVAFSIPTFLSLYTKLDI